MDSLNGQFRWTVYSNLTSKAMEMFKSSEFNLEFF